MIADEKLVQQIVRRNSRQGDLDPAIYDCKACKNRGYFWEIVAKKKKKDSGEEIEYASYESLVECACIPIRRQRISEKYEIDITKVKIKYGAGEGCGYKGFNYDQLRR